MLNLFYTGLLLWCNLIKKIPGSVIEKSYVVVIVGYRTFCDLQHLSQCSTGTVANSDPFGQNFPDFDLDWFYF
jgi:hypothetical protein